MLKHKIIRLASLVVIITSIFLLMNHLKKTEDSNNVKKNNSSSGNIQKKPIPYKNNSHSLTGSSINKIRSLFGPIDEESSKAILNGMPAIIKALDQIHDHCTYYLKTRDELWEKQKACEDYQSLKPGEGKGLCDECHTINEKQRELDNEFDEKSKEFRKLVFKNRFSFLALLEILLERDDEDLTREVGFYLNDRAGKRSAEKGSFNNKFAMDIIDMFYKTDNIPIQYILAEALLASNSETKLPDGYITKAIQKIGYEDEYHVWKGLVAVFNMGDIWDEKVVKEYLIKRVRYNLSKPGRTSLAIGSFCLIYLTEKYNFDHKDVYDFLLELLRPAYAGIQWDVTGEDGRKLTYMEGVSIQERILSGYGISYAGYMVKEPDSPRIHEFLNYLTNTFNVTSSQRVRKAIITRVVCHDNPVVAQFVQRVLENNLVEEDLKKHLLNFTSELLRTNNADKRHANNWQLMYDAFHRVGSNSKLDPALRRRTYRIMYDFLKVYYGVLNKDKFASESERLINEIVREIDPQFKELLQDLQKDILKVLEQE